MNDDSQRNENLPEVDQGKATDSSIVKTHARIRREKVEGSPVKFFTALALIIVLTFSWFYIRRYMTDRSPDQYLFEREHIAMLTEYQNTPKDTGPFDYFARGEKLYSNCLACHQAQGEGMAGTFPPLAGSEYVIHEDAALPTKILLAGLNGPIKVKGSDYNGVMVAFGAAWNDQDVASMVTYIRQSWGNEASGITEEEVATLRSEIGGRGMYTAEELASYFE